MIKGIKIKTTIVLLLVLTVCFSFSAFAATTEKKADATMSETIGSAEGFEDNPYYEILKNMTERDLTALFQVMMNESSRAFELYEPGQFELNVAVIETVFNRVLSNDWPGNTVYDICHAKGQFVCKPYKDKSHEEVMSDALEYVWHEGCTVLPSTEYTCFATKKQTMAKNHVWIGRIKENGKPKKGKGMFFGILK